MPRGYKPVRPSSNKAESGPKENKSVPEVKTEDTKKKGNSGEK